MNQPKSIESASVYIAVGSLQVLGAFFMLDGHFGFLEFLEEYAKTLAWGILVSVPLITISYLLGVLSASVADVLFDRFTRCGEREAAIFRIASCSNSPLMQEKWKDWDLKLTLLKASAIASPTLACGCIMERPLMGVFSQVAVIGAIGSAAFAGLLIFLAIDHSKRGHAFFTTVSSNISPIQSTET